MIVLKHLITLLLSSFTLAKNLGQCSKILAPDEAGETASINITALEETSLLVFHVTDIERTNIPLYFNDETGLLNTADGFYLCTKELHDDGHCSHIGQFVIRYENGGPKEEIINKLLQKGDKVSYNVTDDGVYCIYTHAIGEGVQFKVTQPYGNLSIDGKQELNVLLYILTPLDFILLIFWGCKLWSLRKQKLTFSSVQSTLFLLCLMTYGYHDNLRLTLFYVNKNDMESQSFFWRVMYTLSSNLSIWLMITTFGTYYMWTGGPPGTSIKENKRKDTILMILLGLYGMFSEFFAFFPTQDSTPRSLTKFIEFFFYGAKVMKLLIWAFLLLRLGETIKNTSDFKVKRKLELSRQLAISLPVLIIFTSIFCQFVTSFDTFARSLRKSQSNESVIVNALENSVHYGFVFGLVKNLAYFIIPFMNIGLIYIWREDKANEDEDVNEIELGHFHDHSKQDNTKHL